MNQPTPTSMPTRPGRRVGIDVGSVRVGVAASDPSGLLATPVRTVARDPDDAAAHPATDLEEVAALVAELAAVEVVVGPAPDTRR